MSKYKINKSEITGKKGVRMFKNQVVDEKKFIDGSIDHLVSTGAISEFNGKETPKKSEKTTKKTEKTQKSPEKAE